MEPGQEFEFKIIKMNAEEKKVGLSIRAVGEEATRADVEAYKHPQSSPGTSTIGELLDWKRGQRVRNLKRFKLEAPHQFRMRGFFLP